ncbi:MAG: nucleoside-diphosphate sugar epimerase/dehydratase [Desulfomonile sp.]
MREIDLDSLVSTIMSSPSRRRYIKYDVLLALALVTLAGFSLWLSYNIRFEFQIPEEDFQNWLVVIGLVCVIKPILFFAVGAHKTNWRYVGFEDLEIVVLSCLISSAILIISGFFSTRLYIPRGVIIIDFAIFVPLACQLRIIGRVLRESLLPRMKEQYNTNHIEPLSTIIIGSGDPAEALLNEIKRNQRMQYDVKAIFDDGARKHGSYIHGKKIVGGTWEIAPFASTINVDLAIVAIPSADKHQMLKYHNILKPLGIRVKTLPHTNELPSSGSIIGSMRDLNIIDLLGRDEIIVNSDQIEELIRDKVVLITGAGGSIGSEICLQILRNNPKKLVILDKSENLLFHLHRKLLSVLEEGKESQVCVELCDLRDYTSLKRAMSKNVPGLVLHAAAHKHVFLQELNPIECFNNNVGGMRNIVQLSHELGVERFVLISSDKAVNPTGVMGATKRICEIYCQGYAAFSKTCFLAVRFGNVLGSEGSVIPIFLEQINTGGPVTVTHPEVKRYFMTIPEAVTLVLQASAIGTPGQIMMLDMGNPTKIVDLARQLIWIAGKTEDEISIEFTGLKHGEKLFEELRRTSETLIDTEHKKIHIWKSSIENPRETIQKIDHWLEKYTWLSDGAEIHSAIADIVPEYKPGEWESLPGDVGTRKEPMTVVEPRETMSRLALN